MRTALVVGNNFLLNTLKLSIHMKKKCSFDPKIHKPLKAFWLLNSVLQGIFPLGLQLLNAHFFKIGLLHYPAGELLASYLYHMLFLHSVGCIIIIL